MSILSALATGLDVRRMSSTGSSVLDKDRSFMSLVRYLSRFLRSRPMDSVPPRALASVLAAFAKMRVRDGSLFRFASACFLSKPAAAFSPMDVSDIVNAYSRVGVWDERVFRHMSSAARQRRPINVQEAAVICEAFSCAETRTGRYSLEDTPPRPPPHQNKKLECPYISKVLAGLFYDRE